METTQKKAASFKGIRSAGWVIVICFIIAVLIFNFVLGNPSNFMNNDPNNIIESIRTTTRCRETFWALYIKVGL